MNVMGKQLPSRHYRESTSHHKRLGHATIKVSIRSRLALAKTCTYLSPSLPFDVASRHRARNVSLLPVSPAAARPSADEDLGCFSLLETLMWPIALCAPVFVVVRDWALPHLSASPCYRACLSFQKYRPAIGRLFPLPSLDVRELISD